MLLSQEMEQVTRDRDVLFFLFGHLKKLRAWTGSSVVTLPWAMVYFGLIDVWPRESQPALFPAGCPAEPTPLVLPRMLLLVPAQGL